MSSELTVQAHRPLVNTFVAACSPYIAEPPVQDPDELGAALRAIREKAGRSLDLVAHHGWSEHARLTGSQIAQIERGEKYPRRETLLGILRGTDTTPRAWPTVVRLAVISAELDARLVGFAHAEAAFSRLRKNQVMQVLYDALRDPAHDPARDLEQALQEAARGPAERQRGRARKPAATQANGQAAAPKTRARRRAQ